MPTPSRRRRRSRRQEEDRRPAQRDVDRDVEPARRVDPEDPEQHAERARRPDDAEQHALRSVPSSSSSAERRVGAGDQQEDVGVVEAAQERPRPRRPGAAVVDRGDREQQQRRRRRRPSRSGSGASATARSARCPAASVSGAVPGAASPAACGFTSAMTSATGRCRCSCRVAGRGIETSVHEHKLNRGRSAAPLGRHERQVYRSDAPVTVVHVVDWKRGLRRVLYPAYEARRAAPPARASASRSTSA